jgi:hypothetical protein
VADPKKMEQAKVAAVFKVRERVSRFNKDSIFF